MTATTSLSSTRSAQRLRAAGARTLPGKIPDAVSFGQWLQRYRHARDRSPERLAEIAGCPQATIDMIERGERRTFPEMPALLADMLAIAPAERPHFLRLAENDTDDASTDAMPEPALAPADPLIAQTRLQPPPLVPRPRLSQHIADTLLRWLSPRLAGKTTAVRSWLSDHDTDWQIAWLALDPTDDDPTALVRALVEHWPLSIHLVIISREDPPTISTHSNTLQWKVC